MRPGRDRDDREHRPSYRPDRLRSRSPERRLPAFRSSRPEERYPERDREYPERDRDNQDKDRKYLDREREKDKDRSRYVIDRRITQPEGSKNAKDETKSDKNEKKPASEAGKKSGTEQEQKTKDSSAVDGKPETKSEATAAKTNSVDTAKISESKAADAKISPKEKDEAAMEQAGEQKGGSKIENKTEKAVKSETVSKTNEPTKSGPNTKAEAGKPGEKMKENTETKADSKAQTATKPEAKEQGQNKATAATSGPTAAKPAKDAAKPIANAAKSTANAAKQGATASGTEPGAKPAAAARGRGRGRGTAAPAGRGRGASPSTQAGGKTQPAAKPGATPASKAATPAGTKPTAAKSAATTTTKTPAAAAAIKAIVPKPLAPKTPVGRGKYVVDRRGESPAVAIRGRGASSTVVVRGRGASPAVVVRGRGRGARGSIVPVGRGRGRGRGAWSDEEDRAPGTDYRRMRAVGLTGLQLTRALDNNDWTAMGEVVVTQPRPDQCRRVWIFGDLQIYQAAQRADVYASGPNLGISRFIQLVWIGIPGLLLTEAEAALRCFMDKNIHLETPDMIIVQIGTEDVGARVNVQYAKEAVAGFLEFTRDLMPYTRIIWSEVLMTVPMPTEMKTIVTSMNRAAGNMMEYSLQNSGYCENISMFYEKQHVWFRPSSMYINEQGSLALIDRLKRYISSINMM